MELMTAHKIENKAVRDNFHEKVKTEKMNGRKGEIKGLFCIIPTVNGLEKSIIFSGRKPGTTWTGTKTFSDLLCRSDDSSRLGVLFNKDEINNVMMENKHGITFPCMFSKYSNLVVNEENSGTTSSMKKHSRLVYLMLCRVFLVCDEANKDSKGESNCQEPYMGHDNKISLVCNISCL